MEALPVAAALAAAEGLLAAAPERRLPERRLLERCVPERRAGDGAG
jgi:hypothetical protein